MREEFRRALRIMEASALFLWAGAAGAQTFYYGVVAGSNTGIYSINAATGASSASAVVTVPGAFLADLEKHQARLQTPSPARTPTDASG